MPTANDCLPLFCTKVNPEAAAVTTAFDAIVVGTEVNMIDTQMEKSFFQFLHFPFTSLYSAAGPQILPRVFCQVLGMERGNLQSR